MREADQADITHSVGGHWATFWGDLRAALAAWKRFPVLPLVCIVYGLAAWGTRIPWGIPAAFIVWIFQAGWVGTERIFYLRSFKDKGMQAREALKLTRAFIMRFIALGVVSGVLYMVLLLPISLLLMLLPIGNSTLPSQALATLALDFFLTFVTPALAFTTDTVSKAFRIGRDMLFEGLPGTLWYAVVAPMAIVILSYSQPGRSTGADETGVNAFWVAFSVGAGLVNLAAKGATARYYLRKVDTGDDGSAFEDYLTPREKKEPAEAGS
jgi:hypothetical protein